MSAAKCACERHGYLCLAAQPRPGALRAGIPGKRDRGNTKCWADGTSNLTARPIGRAHVRNFGQAIGRSAADLHRTQAPAITCIDAPLHDVAAIVIVFVIVGVVRIVVVVVGVGSVQSEAKPARHEDWPPVESVVKAAVVKSTGRDAGESTGREACATANHAWPTNGCSAEASACTNGGWTETTAANCGWTKAPAHRGRTKAATTTDRGP